MQIERIHFVVLGSRGDTRAACEPTASLPVGIMLAGWKARHTVTCAVCDGKVQECVKADNPHLHDAPRTIKKIERAHEYNFKSMYPRNPLIRAQG